ncbi:sugar-binding domain-containing protein [uncultured Alistipes sp.]|uniref:glycoside hydrolase family 2 protein n=1 Tax=uncultured Alistipes sp. TaxID=538949 RepID=UPI002619470C|nr:sugar-binding domain-containing protein [uncultured Alistipes sp.]
MKTNELFRWGASLSAALVLALSASGGPVSLNGKWELSFWPQSGEAVLSPEGLEKIEATTIPATVPGNVEIDMEAAGLIADPRVGATVNDLRKYEGYQWCYARRFSAPELRSGQRAELAFGGIDCLGEVWVNGVHVGSSDNMFIEQRYDVTDCLKAGDDNLVQVILRPVVLESQKHLLGTFSMGNFASEESVYIRKAPHMYGWDIMPRLVSAGLWRDVALEIVEPVRIADVNWVTTNVDAETGNARLFVDFQTRMPFDRFDKARMRFTLSRNGKQVYQGERILFTHAGRQIIELQNADLWWPRGYGEPALYEARAELLDIDGEVVDTDVRKIGLRTVKLDLSDINLPDERGRFCFEVNGEKIFVRGTNWVPLDALHSRDAAQYESALKLVTDANCNMIRCWGGNVYEDTRFFELCDENGLMIWQDFAMGCAFYPQRDDFLDGLRREVMSVVLKLRNHPSLVLWAGNNEDDANLYWGLMAFHLDPNRDAVSRRVIPEVLYEFDVTRPYLPSSPYYSEAVWEKGSTDEYLPENHLWGPRGYYKDPFYTTAPCTFVSEIGYHGCPNRSSIERMMSPDCVYPWTDKDRRWNDEWITKSTRRFVAWGPTQDRNNLMLNQVNILFGSVPDDLDEFVFASQAVQAEAMKYFVEMWRGRKFERTGIIWWNVRDGWPIISDAVVDYYGSKKLAYYFLSNVQRNVCLFINDPREGTYPLVAVNDTREAARGTVTVTDAATGREVFRGSYTVPANGRSEVAALPVAEGQGMFVIRYDVGGETFANHYLYGEPPYALSDYKKWLSKTKLYDNRDK